MVARMEELIKRLDSRRGSTDEEQIKLVKTIKNEIIGNKYKKLSYIKLGAVPLVLELLASTEGADTMSNSFRVQCAATVGSFTCVPDGVEAVVKSNGVPRLLETLTSSDEALVAAGARSLKLLYQSPDAQVPVQLPDEAIVKVVELVSAQVHGVSEIATRLLARCCQSPHQQALTVASGILEPLLEMLRTSDPLLQEAAADLLAALMYNNHSLTKELSGHSELVSCLLRLLKIHPVQTRLLAATCLTRLLPHLQDSCSPPAEDVRQTVLQALAQLLGEKGGGEEAPVILATLVTGNPDLQHAAAVADTVGKLAQSLKSENCSAKLQEGALEALAVLCATQEDARAQVLDMNTLPYVITALNDKRPSVRLAGCRCLRSLSKSVKALRSNFDDADLAPSLLRVLREEDPSLQLAALPALSNLLMEFSPLKAQLVAEGCIPDILKLLSASNDDIQYNAIWALESLAYEIEDSVRGQILSTLDWTLVRELMHHPSQRMQEKTLSFIRNLAKRAAFKDFDEWSREEIFPQAMQLLSSSISISSAACEACLYALTNLVVPQDDGHAADKLMGYGAAAVLGNYISHSDAKVRLAAMWAIINMIRGNVDDDTGDFQLRRKKRVLAFRESLVDAVLNDMRESEMETENKNRADVALRLFDECVSLQED